ncbi:lectin like domain-containing protein [Anaerococcus sp.]|uniref:lectin like domain-containing protein n=1 Tax=Anaerococcus sp. TaxID=1872515 RepID=UPI0028FDEDE4|nr:lectin like domain-containing protein [Anaerococcus sp.]MDU1828086.1 lectin like domain-containing protein [Anaerococcus sp.]MDU1864451.1 lectin like domain-containing protein [Anaerococcus sp.]
MKKKYLKNLFALLVMGSLIFQADPALATDQKADSSVSTQEKQEAELIPQLEIAPDPTDIYQDSKDENEILEVSPISDEFKAAQKSGNKVSPLDVNFDYIKTRTRSKSSNLPEKYDLRDHNRVSPVKNQGKNGSCWAFATYGSMESVLSKYGKFDFSEKHLRNTHGFDWGPNDGGNRDIAAAYMARWSGPVDEKDDMYDPVISVSPTDVDRVLDIDKVLYLPDVYNFVDTTDIKQTIMKYGGVYTTINSSKYYENAKNNSYFNPGGGSDDHAVTIVGWDDTFPKELFSIKPKANGAWICKNSWGSSYMDNGYYYVSYEDVYAGKSNACFIPKKKDPNGHIYQYDPLGATRSVGYNKQGYMCNIFKSDCKETLHEIGIFNVSMYTDYKLYVVRNIERTSQLDSEKVEVASGTLQYPGYYTIDISQMELEEGEQFAVMAYLDSSKANYKYPLAVEARINNFSSKADSEPGQSFVSSDGKKWTDLSSELKGANVCLKAITTTGEVIGDDELPVDPNTPEPVKEVKNISVAEGAGGYLRINKKGKLTPIIEPKDIENVAIKIYTLDTDIVDVKADGVIVPKKVGTANILVETRVSRGILRSRFNLEIIPENLRYDKLSEIPVVGDNELYENGEIDNGEKFPDPPKPYEDPYIIRNMSIKIPQASLREGETLDLSEKITVYPDTAKREFTYESKNPEIANIDKNGLVTAKSVGKTTLTVKTNNNIKKSVNVRVLPNFENYPVELDGFDVSQRKSGYFTISLKASQNGVGYQGPATITTRAGNKEDKLVEKTSTLYFKNGEASITYNGGQFGVWRTNFQTDLKLRDIEDHISYEFSKDNKSEAFIREYPKKVVGLTQKQYELGDIKVGQRENGFFTLSFEAFEDGNLYNGMGIVETISEGTTRINTVNFKDGKASIRYSGGDFGVWKKDFVTSLKVVNTQSSVAYSMN